MVEAGIEMGSAGCRAAHAMVGVDARHSGLVERIELKLGILVGGADARVPDHRHDRAPCLIIPSKLSVLIPVVIRLVFKTSDGVVEPGTARAASETSQSTVPG